MNLRALLSLAAMGLLLTACQAMEGLQQDMSKLGSSISSAVAPADKVTAANAGENCPPLAIDPQLDDAIEFYEPSKPSDKTKISELALVGAQSECTLDEEYINMRIDLSFEGAIGPKAPHQKNLFAYPYFVSVTDDKGNELAREIFSAAVTYEKDQKDMKLVETIKQRLPLNDDGSMPAYNVQVGFQLTEEQLFYNAGK